MNVPPAGDSQPSFTSRFSDWVERHERAILFAFLFIFGAMQLASSTNKAMWYDEMYTFHIATQPTWHLFRVSLPPDGNPPLYALLCRFFTHIVGANAIAMRLPALLAYLGAAALLYSFARRRSSAVTALFCAAIFITNPFGIYYATEARPYGLVLFFTSLALVAWQRATDEAAPSKSARWLIPVALAGGVLSHHFAIVSIGLPILIGEIVRSIRRRKVDFRLIAIGALGLLPIAYTITLVHATFELTRHHLMKNEPMNATHLFGGYKVLFGHHTDGFQNPTIQATLLLLVPLLLFRKLMGVRVTRRLRDQWPLHEIAAGVGCSLALFAIFMVIRFTSGYYAGPRYGLATTLGIALLCAFLVSLYSRGVAIGLLCTTIIPLAHWEGIVREPRDGVQQCIRALPKGLPIVIARGWLFPTQYYYAPPDLKERMYYAVGAEYDRRGAYFLEDMAMTPKEIAPPHMMNYKDLLHRFPHFIYVADYQNMMDEEEFLGYLEDNHYKMKDIVDDTGKCAIRVREVTVPSASGGAF